MNLTITISGDTKVIAKFERLKEKILNLETDLTKLGEYLMGYYSGEAFASQGGVFGKVWPKVTDATAKYKAKNWAGTGTQTLYRTGFMKNSFAFESTQNYLRVYNKADYFKYHQGYWRSASSRLPRRVMIGVNTTIKNQVKTIIEKGIRERLDSV